MNILNSIFTLILVYGYPAIAASIFISSAGIPVPGVAIVLVAGSLAASGNTNIGVLFVLVTASAVAGDLVDYFLGKKLGDGVLEKLGKHSKLVRTTLFKTEKYFSRWSGLSIFLSRWLVPPLASTVSVLAGITDYPLKRFLFFDIFGQAISSVIFLSLGYAFSVNWPYIWGYLNSSAGIGVAMMIGFGLIIFGVQRIAQKK